MDGLAVMVSKENTFVDCLTVEGVEHDLEAWV